MIDATGRDEYVKLVIEFPVDGGAHRYAAALAQSFMRRRLIVRGLCVEATKHGRVRLTFELRDQDVFQAVPATVALLLDFIQGADLDEPEALVVAATAIGPDESPSS